MLVEADVPDDPAQLRAMLVAARCKIAKQRALNLKNALFAGSDQGGDHWAVITSLVETCKPNRIDPQAWLSAALTRLATGHPASALDPLMPWTNRSGAA